MGPPRKNRDHRQNLREQRKQKRAGEAQGNGQGQGQGRSPSSSSAPALNVVNENDQQQEAITTATSLQSQPSSSSTSSPSPSPSADIDTAHNQEIQTPQCDTATTIAATAAYAAIRYPLHGHHSDTLPMTVGDRIKALSLVSTATTSPNDQSAAASSKTSTSTCKKNKKKPLSSKLSAAARSRRCSEEEYAIFNSATFTLDMLKEGGSHIKSMLEEVEFSMQMLAEAAEKTVAESTTAAADDTDADVDKRGRQAS